MTELCSMSCKYQSHTVISVNFPERKAGTHPLMLFLLLLHPATWGVVAGPGTTITHCGDREWMSRKEPRPFGDLVAADPICHDSPQIFTSIYLLMRAVKYNSINPWLCGVLAAIPNYYWYNFQYMLTQWTIGKTPKPTQHQYSCLIESPLPILIQVLYCLLLFVMEPAGEWSYLLILGSYTECKEVSISSLQFFNA